VKESAMNRTFFAIFLLVAVFVGFELGYSLSPFLDAGVFADRKEKGVESKIDDALKKHFEELYRTSE
jgi:hypothetical protein